MDDGRGPSGRGFGRPEGGAPGGSARPGGFAGGDRKGRRRGKRQPTTVGASPGGKGPLENENVVVEEEEEEDEDDLADVVVDGENRGGGTHIIGTCVLMCPPSERELRMRKNDIELFERRDPNDRNSSDETLAVKKYTRIVDNVTPDMVRTRDALAMTASYLYGLLDDRPEVPFMVKSKFLWDRLRSVRQDLSLQAITDGFAERLLEQMARFAILSEHELCEETATVTNPDGHNSHLNVEQLAKTLTSLRHMYDDRAARGVGTDRPGAEAEMFAFQLLLRIDSHGRYNVQRSEMLNDLRSARPAVLLSPDVQLALAANRAYHANNIIEFFRLVRSASYLQACVLHKYFSKMRSRALEVVNATYGKQAMPLTEVARLLHTSAEEAEALAAHHGLTVQARRRGKHNAAPSPEADSARKVLMIREAGFIEPADEFPILRSPIVDAKRASTYLAEIVPRLSRQSASAPPKSPRRLAVPKPRVAAAFSPPEKASAAVSGLKAKQAATEADMEKLRAALAAKEAEIKRRKQQLAAAQKAEPAKAAPPRGPRGVGKSDSPPPPTTASPKPAFALAPPLPADAGGSLPPASPKPPALNTRAVPFSPAAWGAMVALPPAASPEPAAERNPPPVSPPGYAGFAPPGRASAEAPEAVGAPAFASAAAEAFAKGEEKRTASEAAAAEAAKRARETAEAEARRAERGREDAARLKRDAARRAEEAEVVERAARAASAARAAREAAATREREAEARREAARREERARAVAAALEAARRDARRAEKSRKARLALAVFRWRRRASFQAHARREARIAAARAEASPIPGIGRSAFRAAPLCALDASLQPRRRVSSTGLVSRAGLSAALAALGAKLDAARNAPWGAPLDVPRILVDAVARDAGTTPASALGSLSHWKLLTCSGGNGEGTESEARSTRAWVRAKLSRGASRARRPETSGETSGALLSLYASRPFAVAEAVGGDAFPGKPNEATLWVCARDARDAPPPRYASASAALFVLRASAGAIPSAEEARLRAFASSLVRVGGDQARAFANPRLVPPRALPLLVLVEGEAFEGSAAERRATEAAIASAVAGAVASAAPGNVENATPSVTVRVDSIGGSIAADAGSEASRTQARKLWARRNDALAEGLSWMASVAPPEPYFRAAYLRDEVRDALARRGGTRDAPAATPGACVRAWNDATESVRARLASAHARAPSGLAAEFAEADTPGAFRRNLQNRGGALAENDAAAESILAAARLPPFPDAPSGATLESLVGSYLSALDPSGPLPPGAVAACLAKSGLAGAGGPRRVSAGEADPRRPHRVWPAVFREIFARRLADIETAQKAFGAGPAYVSAFVGVSETPTKAPLSDLQLAQAPEPDPVISRSPAKIRKTPEEDVDRVAPASSQKRRRVDSDDGTVTPLSLETALPRLARAKAEVENFEAWLLQAASPTPHAGGFFDEKDAAAKLRKLAGTGDLKTISF